MPGEVLRRCALFLAVLPATFLLTNSTDVPRPAAAAPAPPPPWGAVTGRFVFDGPAPARKVIHRKGAAVRDAACCAREDLLADDLVVDPKTKGIANVFVFLPKAKRVHPKLAKAGEKERRCEVRGCRFQPHAMVVRKGQTVVVTSKDRCAHAVQSWNLEPPRNVLLTPSATTRFQVEGTSSGPPFVGVRCPVHPYMQGWWLVID